MSTLSQTNIRHFTDLFAWQKNHRVVLEVYRLTKVFPRDEMFGLTSQLRRAASSITANIAEGFGRYTAPDKMRFYVQARGSSTELQNHIILAHDLGYITDDQFNKLKVSIFEGYKILCGLITRMQSF